MKNRRNIIESELPPQNPLDIWMKDGKFYRSTKKGWTLIEDQMEFTDSKLMSKSTATSGTIGVNKETGKASIYNDVTKEWSPLGGGLTETTWLKLKDKRDAGKLTPGALYRITDYNCTTTQENTQSAGHQFDIVLLALSENKLAEEGWAMMHDNIYDVTFSDGVTKKCYVYDRGDNLQFVDISTMLGSDSGIPSDGCNIDEINKTVSFNDIMPLYSTELIEENLPYNYFQNSNLSAWKVWYCLDNDKSRFAWADKGNVIPGELINVTFDKILPRTGTPTSTIIHKSDGDYIQLTGTGPGATYYYKQGTTVGDSGIYIGNGNPSDPIMGSPLVITAINTTEPTIIPEGKGVIYRLIDEFNNDVAYDFKNIQYKTKLDSDGFYNINGDDSWTYSLNCYDVDNSICYDASIICATLVVSDMTLDCNNNFISCNIGDRKSTLQLNQIFTNYSFDDEITNSVCFVKMFDSKNVRIGFGNDIRLYDCSSFNLKYEGNAIYINNKKVLTES